VGEEKKTQLGTPSGRTVRPTGSPPVAAAAKTHPAAAGTPDDHIAAAAAAAKSKTSYLAEAPDPLLGSTVAGRYQIIRKLGEGGMGAVYLALHNVLEKQVALKVLHGEFARKPELVERFMQEAKAASRIRHENVIDISDFGATPDGLVFFAMELLHGHDLHEELMRAKLSGQLLPWSRTKRIFLQICSALSAAHARGIVHRDLKPENVFLVEFLGDPDFVKLLDFGIAKLTDVAGNEEGARKLTKTGMLFGTPEYMSPEQARGDQVDHRVDIYAMGCILFQLVSNRVPFEAENFMGILSQHLTEPPPQIAPEVFDQIGAPRAIGEIIDRALIKDRNARFQAIDDMAAAIREVCGDAAPADRSAKLRAASVPAPSETTRSRPATGQVEPAGGERSRGLKQTGRVKTQWTGNLSVPEVPADDTPPPRGRSKLPLLLGALVVLGGGAAVAIVALGGKDNARAGEVANADSAADSAAEITAPPPPPPPAPNDPLPSMVEIAFDSSPRGANVVDVVNGNSYGTTPTSFSLPGSTTARQFRFELKGYGTRTVELIPDRPRIELKQELVKGSTRADAVTQVPDAGKKPATTATTTPTTTPTTPVTRPDSTRHAGTGSASTKPEPETKPDSRPDDKPGGSKPLTPCGDDDTPCLKSFP
jgi:eukaryotic-like serine/threonine-protein kinase